jgi:hypothetical protein
MMCQRDTDGTDAEGFGGGWKRGFSAGPVGRIRTARAAFVVGLGYLLVLSWVLAGGESEL